MENHLIKSNKINNKMNSLDKLYLKNKSKNSFNPNECRCHCDCECHKRIKYRTSKNNIQIKKLNNNIFKNK